MDKLGSVYGILIVIVFLSLTLLGLSGCSERYRRGPYGNYESERDTGNPPLYERSARDKQRRQLPEGD